MPNTGLETSKSVHVAVGVVINRDRQVLIALRNPDQHQGGLWEFPGGKVGQDETVQEALKRELHEEVNLSVRECARLLTIEHDYGDKEVFLDVWVVSVYSGEPEGREGQQVKWIGVDEFPEHDFPAANKAIVEVVTTLLDRS